jgi:hypothetical protein
MYQLAAIDIDAAAQRSKLAPLVAGESDVAIGSRLARGAQTRRGFKREFISRGYMLVLRLALGVRFTDAQCGFKALRTEVARQIVPKIEDQTWFFDTELLVLAQRAGFRVHEVPVKWTDDPDSRVDILRTAIDDLRGVGRLRFGLFRAPKS